MGDNISAVDLWKRDWKEIGSTWQRVLYVWMVLMTIILIVKVLAVTDVILHKDISWLYWITMGLACILLFGGFISFLGSDQHALSLISVVALCGVAAVDGFAASYETVKPALGYSAIGTHVLNMICTMLVVPTVVAASIR